jgi:hypothetical protein
MEAWIVDTLVRRIERAQDRPQHAGMSPYGGAVLIYPDERAPLLAALEALRRPALNAMAAEYGEYVPRAVEAS